MKGATQRRADHRDPEAAILKQGETGLSTAELCRQHGISEQTYYRWKAKYGAPILLLMADCWRFR
jgi:transposase-like protein